MIRLLRPEDKDLVLVTDLLDPDLYPAGDLFWLYSERWGIEEVFQQVTEVFGLEGLIGGTPQACIFQLSFCLLLYNMIQVVRGHVAEGYACDTENISTEKLFDDVEEQLIAWNVMIAPEATIRYFERELDQDSVKARLRTLLGGTWSDTWVKSPSQRHHRKTPRKRNAHPPFSVSHSPRSLSSQLAPDVSSTIIEDVYSSWWETHTAPEYNVRPQEAINRRIVDDSDLVVGIFWTKLGTPTGEADSGTLEEIERVAKAGKPAMLYFSHAPIDPDKIDLKQMERLKGFKERISANALIEKYSSSLDFRDKFARQIELKIRDLQKAEESGKPVPLSLEFVSRETQTTSGSSVSVAVDIPVFSSDPSDDDELRPFIENVIQSVRERAGTTFVALAIANTSSLGVRNLYVEMSIKPSMGTFLVSDSDPLTRRQYATYFQLKTFADRYAYAPLWDVLEWPKTQATAKTLTKEHDDEWKFSCEWEAIQPQRVRVVEPVLYLQADEACEAVFTATVYADSFATPIVLEARLTVRTREIALDRSAVLSEAEKLRAIELKEKEEKNETSSSSSSVASANVSRLLYEMQHVA